MKKLAITFLILSQFFILGLSKQKEIENPYEKYNLSFFEHFSDEILINYLKKGLGENQDLKIANLKLQESEKIVKLSLSQELPQIDFTPVLGRTFASSDLLRGDNNFQIHSYSQNRFVLPLSASWEIDIWRKNRLKTKIAQKNVKIIEQDKKSAYVIYASSFSNNYFNLIKINSLLELEKEQNILIKELLDLTKNKEKIGLSRKDDVLKIKETLVNSNAKINDLEAKKEVIQNQLGYLLNDKLFNEIQTSNFDKIKTFDTIPNELNSEVILNRPDVISASEGILKADMEAKIAKRDLLPSFKIMGTLGFNGYNDLSKIFGAHTGMADLWVVPELTIFDAGKKYNLMKLRKLELKEAKVEYERTILNSIKETNDALAVLKTQNKNYSLSKDILNIQLERLKLKYSNKNNGLANKLDYNLYQQSEILARKQLVSDKIDYINSAINLYRTLGGSDFSINTQNL